MNQGSKETPNPSIACSVETCNYHSGSSHHCTLHAISVGCSHEVPHTIDGTMCASFAEKN